MVHGVEPVEGRARPRWLPILVIVAALVPIAAGVLGALAVHRQVRVVYVPSDAMAPAYPRGSRLLVTRADGERRVGEVVTYTAPDDPSVTLVKRIVAVGPATVALVDGRVVVDGRPLDEPYLAPGEQTNPTPSGVACTAAAACAVAPGELWVLGDNRENSADSRVFGAVPASAVTGVVARRLFG